METFQNVVRIIRQLGSYRTYEEWKLSISIVESGTNISSYRTYEEWKQPH